MNHLSVSTPAFAPLHTAARAPLSNTRVATHDGYIWPVERHKMTDPVAIIARMAADIAAALRAMPEETVNLIDIGWTRVQFDRYGVSAGSAFARAALAEGLAARTIKDALTATCGADQ